MYLLLENVYVVFDVNAYIYVYIYVYIYIIYIYIYIYMYVCNACNILINIDSRVRCVC